MKNESPKAVDFVSRQKRLLKSLGKGVAVFPSPPPTIRNNDVHFPFRQSSNLYYLTGFREAQSIGLFAPATKNPVRMFVQPKDKTKELWEGPILGPAKAKKLTGADAAYPSSPSNFFDEALIQALCESDCLYYRVGVDQAFDQRIFHLLSKASKRLGRTGRALWPILDPDEILGEMRLEKDDAEIQRMQVAADITARAHSYAMQITRPGMYEYEIEAALFQSFRAQGADRVGYESIVAAGSNACVLHYIENSKKMQARDLLLIDAGAEYQYYTADITRCFPVGGRFSEPQKEVYSAVLNAQKACIDEAKPGSTMKKIHDTAVEVLVEELKKLKLLKGPSSKIIKDKSYRQYFPHGTGHWLGMDVHDVGRYYDGDYDTSRKLKAGYAFTIEPGLYFGPGTQAPAKYKGIGVRIEDDIVITNKGCRILTAGVPKEIDEVENLCNQQDSVH